MQFLLSLLVCAVVALPSRVRPQRATQLDQEAQLDPDFDRDVIQLITSKGYPCEQHYATTPDGFILGLHRIPYGRKGRTKPGRPVFLQHGLLDSSATWVLNFPTQSLAFILADAGFDVWLGNSRGNLYSRNNTHLQPHQPEFWDWTWDELAKYDVPTVIDFVLERTGSSNLSWVGHSRGTQMMFAALSLPENQQLANKLSIFVALAPVAFLSNLKSPLLQFLAMVDRDDWLDWLGIHEFLPAGAEIDKVIPGICDWFPSTCNNLGYLLFGCCDPQNFNQTRLSVYWSHMPAGTSAKEMAHYSQGVHDGGNSMYDYGEAGNMEHYNQPTPPTYDVTKIPKTLPIALFTGGNDILADPTDVSILSDLLTGVIYHNEHPDYTHMDFTWGMNAYRDIYPNLLQLLQTYR